MDRSTSTCASYSSQSSQTGSMDWDNLLACTELQTQQSQTSLIDLLDNWNLDSSELSAADAAVIKEYVVYYERMSDYCQQLLTGTEDVSPPKKPNSKLPTIRRKATKSSK